MWRLKIGEDANEPHLYSTNNFVGRQTWEFDPNHGTTEAIEEVEEARRKFYENRNHVTACGDLIWRLQFLREKKFKQIIPQVKVGDGEEITYETTTATVKRAVNFLVALQAEDGHWPAQAAYLHYYLLPPTVFALYISGHLNTVFSAEHRREIFRTIYNHQQSSGSSRSRSEQFGVVYCYHNEVAPLRTVKVNGPHVGRKFFGCNYWPKTCGFMKFVEEVDEIRVLQAKIAESTTEVTGLELRNQMLERKVKHLLNTNLENEEKIEEISIEASVLREQMCAAKADRKLMFALLWSWVFFAVAFVYY